MNAIKLRTYILYLFFATSFLISCIWSSCTIQGTDATAPGVKIQGPSHSSPSVTVQPSNSQKVDDAYIFPVRPGMQEWKNFTSHNQMVTACWVPEDILENMSTAGLVETVVNYPLGGDYGSSIDFQEGVDRVSRQFNGLAELFRRDDAEVQLLAKYRTMNPQAIGTNWSNSQRFEYKLQICNIELILAQNSLISQLNTDGLRDLVSEALVKYRVKQQGESAWDPVLLNSNMWILARAMHHMNYAPFLEKENNDRVVKIFVKGGGFVLDKAQQEELIYHAERFLVEK
jgi:hypothetical protein